MRLGLRIDRRERGVGGAGEPGQPQGLVERLFAQACIGQHQGHALLLAQRCHVGPDLRLKQYAHPRLKVREKAPYRAGCVPGLPDQCVRRVQGISALQQRCALSAARGGAGREQQAQAGFFFSQRFDENGRCPRLAQRYGVNPQRPALLWLRVVAQALFDGVRVTRLSHCATRQAAAHQRLGQPHQQ